MPRTGVSRVFAGALAAVAIGLVASCAAPAADPEPQPLPDGVTVALVQLRSDVAARQAQVEVHNATGAPIEIGDVTVTDPRFSGAATRVLDRVTVVPDGGTTDIRIQLPEMACDVSEGESTVELAFLVDGSETIRTSPLPDRLEFLPPMHDQECRARVLADAATLTIASFEPSPPGVPADLALEIAPTGDAAARIAAIHSTNLLSFGDPAARRFPIGVVVAAGDTAPTTVHLPLLPQRCDPHVVQEDKRGTVFELEIELDGESGLVQVAATEEMRARILNWVADWCRFGQD